MMRPLNWIEGMAAALPLANIDTDKIIPAEFLKTTSRAGLGRSLFHGLRYDQSGGERPDFVLNRDPWRAARILIALENFGCGSSREHAPWALTDFGFRVIVAPSFADIFANNCIKNGILPVILDRGAVDHLMNAASLPSTAVVSVSLSEQFIEAGGQRYVFDIAPQHKRALLTGLDEIEETLALDGEISAFEKTTVYPRPPIPLDLAARL